MHQVVPHIDEASLRNASFFITFFTCKLNNFLNNLFYFLNSDWFDGNIFSLWNHSYFFFNHINIIWHLNNLILKTINLLHLFNNSDSLNINWNLLLKNSKLRHFNNLVDLGISIHNFFSGAHNWNVNCPVILLDLVFIDDPGLVHCSSSQSLFVNWNLHFFFDVVYFVNWLLYDCFN